MAQSQLAALEAAMGEMEAARAASSAASWLCAIVH